LRGGKLIGFYVKFLKLLFQDILKP